MNTFTAISPKNTRLTGFALAGLGTTLFSCKGILIKLCYQQGATPEVIMTLRMFFAMPFYVAVAVLLFPENKQHMTGKNIAVIAVLGCLGYYLASLLDLLGLVYITASLERIILYTYPVIVVVLSIVMMGKKYDSNIFACIVFIYAGLLLVFISEQTGAIEQPYLLHGATLVIASACSFALYFVGTEIMTQKICPRFYTALAMLCASGAIFLHSAMTLPTGSLITQAPRVYLLCFIIAIVCTVIPSFMVSAGIQRIGAARAGAVGSVGPIVTLLLAALVLHEPITEFQLIGIVMAIWGVYLLGKIK